MLFLVASIKVYSDFRGPVYNSDFRGPVYDIGMYSDFRGPVYDSDFRGPVYDSDFRGPNTAGSTYSLVPRPMVSQLQMVTSDTSRGGGGAFRGK